MSGCRDAGSRCSWMRCCFSGDIAGTDGYYGASHDIPAADRDEARSIVNEYNTKLGVSKAQEEAMKAGSMFGFHVPAADPRNYDADGKPVMPKDRGAAR